jgi:hypothetical protein
MGEYISNVFGHGHGNGAGRLAASNVHAQEMGEVTQVLDFGYGAESNFNRREPRRIIARGGNVVHVEGDHGEDMSGAEK